MLTIYIKYADGSISTKTDTETLSAALRDPGAVFWLDMSQPTAEEYKLLETVFHFHPLAIEDVIHDVQRPKIESYNHVGDAAHNGYFYMVIHGPDLESFKQHDVRTKELDMFVSQRYLLTIHEQALHSIEQVMGRCKADVHAVLDPGIDMVLYNVLDHLVDDYTPILDYLGDHLDDLEDEAAANPRPELLGRIAASKRDLLNLRRIIGPQREVIAQLTRGEVPFIQESTRIYLRDVLDHLNRHVESLELYRDLVLGARDIYMSSISNNLNQIMKTLTIISVIALPMTVVTGFFGMNFDEPIFHDHRWFVGAMAFMISVIVVMLYVFHRRRWI